MVMDNVLQGDSPEDLLNSAWKGLRRVCSFSCGKTDKLSTSEGEGSRNEDGAEATETVLEGTRVIPKSGAPVFAINTPRWATAAHEDESNNHEDDGGREFKYG